MKRYLNCITPICTMIMVAGSLNIMLNSNQNLANLDNTKMYKSALVSDKMLDAHLVKNKDEINFVTETKYETENKSEVKKEKIKEVENLEPIINIKPLPEEMAKGTVNTIQLNVREGSNKDTAVITRVMEGDTVGLTGNTSDNWVEIVVQDEAGSKGWVNGKYINNL